MGVTIHYRGTLDDLARVEEFEDRVLDVVSALGGQATIWRSFGQQDSRRVVRGLLVQMAPGQDTLSLLLSPEGQLLNLFEIRQAEDRPLAESPCCFVKTQFGSLQGHVAVVSLFDALRNEFFSNLEVEDESGYYRQRDAHELTRRLKFLEAAISGLGERLEGSAFSPEAAEDPELLAARITRVAELVARKMGADPETESEAGALSPAGAMSPESTEGEPSLEDIVRLYSKARREAEVRQERLMRRIEEGRGQGLSTDEALLAALQESRSGRLDTSGFEPTEETDTTALDPEEWDKDAGVEDLPEWAADAEDLSGNCEEEALDWPDPESTWRAGPHRGEGRHKHPALSAAEQLYLRLTALGPGLKSENGFYLTALNGVGELLGGLAQATGLEIESRASRAAVIVQLKRALKGLAFCRGGVFGLRSSGALDEQANRDLQDQLKSILEQLHELLVEAWNE
jgi:hypothetical protein